VIKRKNPLPFKFRLFLSVLTLQTSLASFGLSLPTIAWASSIDSTQAINIRLLNDKGIYWYERFRFDLATQSFNKILLIDPTNASALRWQGLIDLARSDIQASKVWLGRIQSLYGTHPYAIELSQSIILASEKRQQLAELRYQANSEQPPQNLQQQLRTLFQHPPMGEAAIQIYRLMNNTNEDRAYARFQVAGLIRQFPDDRRYQNLLNELGGANPVIQISTRPNKPVINAVKVGIRTETKTTTKTATEIVNEITTQTATIPENQTQPASEPRLSGFEQGQLLANQAQKLIGSGDKIAAASQLQEAVDLNPNYPWFRYDLATLLDDQGDTGSKMAAQKVMEEGLVKYDSQEMRFASALLASRQNRNEEALTLLGNIPRKDWTDGMTALDKRIRYGQHLDQLKLLQRQGQLNELASAIAANPSWKNESEVKNIDQVLQRKKQVRLRMSYENALIDGDEGVSKISSKEIPIQLDLPLDFERTLFIRADILNTNAGKASPTSVNFAKLGTTLPTNPAITSDRLEQNFKGHVIGIGIQTDQYRVDLGTTTGDYPVKDWVGGLQWRTNLGDASLRLELSRRLITGSVLSTTGAIDPLTGETWGGARRNGMNAVYYNALSPTVSVIGIARANLITGKNIPDNREFNLQGIASKTIFQKAGHEVEIGASLFLWSFKKNLRFYTFGQGGYYSPQAFGSLSFPITWTGKMNSWAWQLQARIGASESREDNAELYPLNPELAAAAAAQGNPTIQIGGPGGGTSTGLRLSLEKQVLSNFVLGGHFEINRSEGYNPDSMQLYMKYSFGDFFEMGAQPEGISPYSRF
jgi:tetratricopeptide (TPR) repeat protein